MNCGFSYHPYFQSLDVKLSDLPVAEDIEDDLYKAVDPEDGCHYQKKNNPTTVLNSGRGKKTRKSMIKVWFSPSIDHYRDSHI